MTSINPPQMRWIASDREETAEAWPEYRIIAAKLREDAAALRTAADKLEAEARWYSLYQEAAADRDAILEAFNTDNSSTVIAAADGLDRLRAVIKNAPHMPPCVHYAAMWQTIGDPCTCWKADAL